MAKYIYTSTTAVDQLVVVKHSLGGLRRALKKLDLLAQFDATQAAIELPTQIPYPVESEQGGDKQ